MVYFLTEYPAVAQLIFRTIAFVICVRGLNEPVSQSWRAWVCLLTFLTVEIPEQ